MILVIDQEMFNRILSDQRILNSHEFKDVDSIYFSIPIEEIPAKFFQACNNLTAIHLPTTVKKISNCAFEFCKNLNTINSLKNIQYVEDEAFAHCESLKEAVFSSQLKTLGKGAFFDCQQLETIDLGEQLEHIPENCFYGTYSLRKIFTAATTISDQAFERSGIYEFDFSNVKSIGNYTFELATNLEHVYIPSTTTYIGKGCFHRCYNLQSAIIDANIGAIPENLFEQAINLKDIVFMNQTVKDAEDNALKGCFSLSSIAFITQASK